MNGRDYITPRQLAAAIGVSESSLKRWTDQGLLPAVKTAGGHRCLSLTGVVHFLRTTKTPLVNPEILELACPLAPGLADLPSTRASFGESLRRGDRRACSAVAIRGYLSGHGMAALCDGVLQPAMKDVGEAWERGELDIFQEHRATQICRIVLAELLRLVPEPAADAKRAVGGAGPGDPYALPTAMVELCLAELGWHTIDLGPDTPFEAFNQAVETERPDLLWLSVSLAPQPHVWANSLKEIIQSCEARNVRMAVGGRAISGGIREVLPQHFVGDSMQELERMINPQPFASLNDASDVIGL